MHKILIANRSEIACRIIRACRELGHETVAVYSEADEKALHVILADEAVCIGPAPAKDSYLKMEAIIQAALDTGADAIHPGYGFLAENAEFNQKVRDAGLIFIGPKPEPVSLLGSKTASRKVMIDSGVPVIPGMKGSSKEISDYEKLAEEMGFPVLIKASAGGGGKGMRVVRESKELAAAVEGAMREALSAFGSDEVFLEKYIESPRHVEIQVAADDYGNAVYLFERECSIQRRHQKIIEESPSVALDSELRKRMGETAIRVVAAANYNNVGTVEFLLDNDRNFYFLEVNTRIQVEHPITEMVTGVDLLKLQIDLAFGGKMPFKQEELSQRGHAIECRIYAEDDENNFMPSSGDLLFVKEPVGPGIRYDTGVYSGSEVPVFYDPVMAKLITYGADREEARLKMISALKENILLGVKTSIAFMKQALEHPEFINGNTFTDFIEKHMPNVGEPQDDISKAAMIAAFSTIKNQKKSFAVSDDNSIPEPWQEIGEWEI